MTAKWKHGWIPANDEARAVTEHHGVAKITDVVKLLPRGTNNGTHATPHLEEDIKANGVKNPIRIGHHRFAETNSVEPIVEDGRARLLAAHAAGETHVPVVVYGHTPAGREALFNAIDKDTEEGFHLRAKTKPVTREKDKLPEKRKRWTGRATREMQLRGVLAAKSLPNLIQQLADGLELDVLGNLSKVEGKTLQGVPQTRELPTANEDGTEIKSLEELAAVMGVHIKAAPFYVLTYPSGCTEELLVQAKQAVR